MRVVVVGAGIAGLTAARRLADRHDVVVVDKGRSVGGRLATRRIGGATFDHGAQFFTVRGEAFRDQVDDWIARDLARVWCHGFGADDGHPRYCGTRGMNALAKDLARGLDVLTGRLVFSCRPGPSGDWEVVIDDGSVLGADTIVLTSPVPQSWSLVAGAGVEIPEALFRRDYHRTIALLTRLDRPGCVAAPGGIQFDPSDPDAPFGFIGDNAHKGISAEPAITFHATRPWSLDHWDDDRVRLRRLLVERAGPWLGDAVVLDAQVKKWRFAAPVDPWPEPCLSDRDHRVVLAGDIFAGPRVEGAFDSGTAAAEAVLTF